MHVSVRALIVTAGLLVSGASLAQTASPLTPTTTPPYPTKAVRLIVPFAPGGTNDILGRIVADKVGERLGQTFVVDNRAGANSVLGSEIVARASPDGYTLLIVSAGLAVNPSISRSLP